MRKGRVPSILFFLMSFFSVSTNAAPWAEHVLFSPEFDEHQHVHMNWTMGCSLFRQLASGQDTTGGFSYGTAPCRVEAPAGAGISQYGIELYLSASAHYDLGSPSPDFQNASASWPYSGAETQETAGTIVHWTVGGGRVLYDVLDINYNFWYKITPSSAPVSVFSGNPSQTKRYGLP